ncbi:GNAT family N-acetyltransferase [Haloarchaeobius iranensis]|uniref:Acetyltransferase (GNAT) family protein n=1 Tax=Haloarchaeobius iranensis TaxID=996166 RepID=A0A1G9YAE6_9EURY|nr:GNAT family N-acetyltransferase [Haloarchaeobius iranensis]SDN05970.1 Acetyltransferase (GNAT) family protein [Haloarchaeobius iranensis]
MELVEATTDDIQALVDRWHSLARAMEAHDELNELASPDVTEAAAEGFRRQLADDAVDDYLGVEDGEQIGLVTLREGTHPSREYSRYLRIVNLFIDAEYRDSGHGAAVVDRVKTLACERGCDYLKVSCEWGNEGARRFYRDTGFRPKQVDFAQPLE